MNFDFKYMKKTKKVTYLVTCKKCHTQFKGRSLMTNYEFF